MITQSQVANVYGVAITMTPELLADTLPVGAYIHRDLLRSLTALSFGESWYGPRQELERLEHQRTINWDSPIYDDEDEDW